MAKLDREPGDALRRARETLEAARMLLDGGYHPGAVAQAWQSMVFATMKVLLPSGKDAQDGSRMLKVFLSEEPGLAGPHRDDILRVDALQDRAIWALESGRVPGEGAAREAVEAAAALLRDIEEH